MVDPGNEGIWNGKSLRSKPPDLTIETDASLLGWGAHAAGAATGGQWTPQERSLHINLLELNEGVLAVKTFAKGMSNIHIQLKMDNTTVEPPIKDTPNKGHNRKNL